MTSSFVLKPGWVTPLGHGRLRGLSSEMLPGIKYARLVFEDFRLGHAATLFLLQGASLRQLFTDVEIKAGSSTPSAGGLFNLAFAETEPLWSPPPRLPQLVLARLDESDLKADAVDRALLAEELRRRG